MEKNMTTREIELISDPEKVDMADDWYDFAEPNHFWIRGRYNALEKLLPGAIDYSTCRFLEIGCGNGLIIDQFERFLNTTVDGCDLNLLALNKITNLKGDLYCLNIFDKPEKLLNKYDGILLMDVIEHIDDDSAFLKTATKYLKKGGLVIINVPSINFFYSRYDIAAGHKRRYSKKMMKNLFDKNDIELVRISYWGLTLVPIVLLRKLLLRIVNNNDTIKNGFKPPNETFNKVLDKILRWETKLVKSPFIGTSLIAIGRIRNK
jgi:2-polyprenyl-3-methyl-5-hydroxy-6-metoxy-1,4-benzoquinol methylase